MFILKVQLRVVSCTDGMGWECVLNVALRKKKCIRRFEIITVQRL